MHISSTSKISLAALFMTFAASVSANVGADFYLQLPIDIEPSAHFPESIKRECSVDMLLGNYALSEIGLKNGSVKSISNAEDAAGGTLVKISILAVHGFGGGGWSGPKSMAIRVDMKRRDGPVISSVLNRGSRGGAFGGFSGTCAILNRVAGALGKDVAVWLGRNSGVRPTQAAVSAPGLADEVSEEKLEPAK